MYILLDFNGMYYLQIFRGWGLLVLCVVAYGFVTKRPKPNPVVWRHSPLPEVKATSRQSHPPLHTKPTAPSPGKSVSNTYH
jgi:hypothetical protein